MKFKAKVFLSGCFFLIFLNTRVSTQSLSPESFDCFKEKFYKAFGVSAGETATSAIQAISEVDTDDDARQTVADIAVECYPPNQVRRLCQWMSTWLKEYVDKSSYKYNNGTNHQNSKERENNRTYHKNNKERESEDNDDDDEDDDDDDDDDDRDD